MDTQPSVVAARSAGPTRPAGAGFLPAIPLPVRGSARPARNAASRTIETVLLATDLGPASESATDRALELAVQLEAGLLIVSVIGTPPTRPAGEVAPRMDQLRDRRQSAAGALVSRGREAGVAARFLIWSGDPGESIVAAAEAEGANLIVVGSHGRTGFNRSLMGSVSDYVIRHARAPVVVVRPADR
jgi:nucleotide-binding universal stress UspA family protein